MRCLCDDGYVAEGLRCFAEDPGPCDTDTGWGAPCSADTCRDGSLCSSMLSDTEQRMCFLPCQHDADCFDVATGNELCGARVGDVTYCYIVCLNDSDCPCGFSCVSVADIDYSFCSPR